jgi:hypothetical protein
LEQLAAVELETAPPQLPRLGVFEFALREFALRPFAQQQFQRPAAPAAALVQAEWRARFPYNASLYDTPIPWTIFRKKIKGKKGKPPNIFSSLDHPNLFMVGSGVFPTVATGNPTLTIALLALWAAQTIAKDLE